MKIGRGRADIRLVALQGTLDTFALDDVLQLLSVTGKTGCLHVAGPDVDGRIWVDAGSVVGARSSRSGSRADVVESIFDMMRLPSGQFDFESGAQPVEAGAAHSVTEILAEVETLRAEWEQLVAVVPTLSVQARLVTDLRTSEVTVPAEQWRMLATVIGPPSLVAVADTLEISELAMARIGKTLVDAGLVELIAVDDQVTSTVAPEPIPESPEPEVSDPAEDLLEPEPDRMDLVDEPAEAPARAAEPVDLGEHLAGLSPRAAAAVAAAVPRTTGHPSDETDVAAEGEEAAGDDRSNLMRFLSSARS